MNNSRYQFNISRDQYMELEKIAIGAYYPLEGFLEEEDFLSVVETMRLSTGEIFPLPISLNISSEDAVKIATTGIMDLIYKGEIVGTLIPQSIFTIDKKKCAEKLFCYDNDNHPGVKFFYESGDFYVGGPITIHKRFNNEFAQYELTPQETKLYFNERNWDTVAAFHTRNVPHRAHEWLQRASLDLCDGLLIHPILGRKKPGDFSPAAILKGYEALISGFYPRDRVLLASLSTAGRYAGPREALYHALVRKNYGCTHIVIGRDHAGVGTFYEKYASQQLCKKYEKELAIKILAFGTPLYCRLCDGIVTDQTCPHIQTDPSSVSYINGTDIRAIMKRSEKPESYLMRSEVIQSLNEVNLFI